ncbi:hypothetical protein CDD83_7766 [Cordyceps sp. RAO-2017]|nr:hypothetical protein CDD83_7766 [Cordyceps sp. RAO-2017]
MKIKALSRSASAHQAAGSDAAKQPRNLDAALHPFERAREYQRALNAVKLERMHAAPFVGQLGRGHVDGVYSLARDPASVQRFASGSGDGVVKVWDLADRADEVWQATAHDGIVKGLEWTRDRKLLTCAAADRSVKLFDPYRGRGGGGDDDMDADDDGDDDDKKRKKKKKKRGDSNSSTAPISSWLGASGFTSLSHHGSRNAFAASSAGTVCVYDLERHTAAPETLRWPTAVDTITDVAFSPVETAVLASAATDRGVVVYDVRAGTAVARTVLGFATNRLAWSPMEAFNLATASEDHNAYLFDVRRFDRALNVFKDHVAAVTDVDFSPTGHELATASWDRTVRLWARDGGHARDVYHTKRMQRVTAARWTADARYLVSGSDDGNVRLWRARAADRPAAVRSARHRQALEYGDALVARFAHLPELRRIRRHRHLPKVLKKAAEIKADELRSLKRRQENERKHSAQQARPRRSERDKVVLARDQ